MTKAIHGLRQLLISISRLRTSKNGPTAPGKNGPKKNKLPEPAGSISFGQVRYFGDSGRIKIFSTALAEAFILARCRLIRSAKALFLAKVKRPKGLA